GFSARLAPTILPAFQARRSRAAGSYSECPMVFSAWPSRPRRPCAFRGVVHCRTHLKYGPSPRRRVESGPSAWHSSQDFSNYRHKPFGFQSGANMPYGIDESCKTNTSARRVSAPVAVNSMGGPPGMITVSPGRAALRPAGVSRHVSPLRLYQASGPEWRWTTDFMPGVKTASMYCAVYAVSTSMGSGPIRATRSPPGGRQSAAAIVSSQVSPSDSTTVPFGVFTASAAERVGYLSRCQNTGALPNRPNDCVAVM